jgi:Flp pilus assembly protein CpaB
LIAPGDRVDVLSSSDETGVSETILRDRRVIAIASKASPAVTLEVNPTEAQTLAVAIRAGAIHLTPRAAIDPVAQSEPTTGLSHRSDTELAADRTEAPLPIILRGSKDDPLEDAF